MAIMSDTDRAAVHAEIMRNIPGSIGILKAELRAALDAADQWVSDNAASFNAALPLLLPARSTLTTAQKAWLLSAVIERRYNVGA